MKIAALPEMNFKDTELGPLPEEWRVVKFDKAFLRARRVPKVKRSDCQATGLVPVIDQSQSFIAGYVDDVTPYTGELPVIIFGDHTRAIKYVDFPFVAGADGTQVLLPNTQLFEPLFLYYALLKAEIPSRGYNRHFMILQEQMFPLPPLSEQRAIAHVLRTVQAAKEAGERVSAALRQLKKSLMRHLFTYGPAPLDKTATVPLRETELGPLPAHWQVVRLGDLVGKGVLWIKNGFPQGEHNQTGAGIPHLRPFNITDAGNITLSQIKYVPSPSEDSLYWVLPGDIIFNNTNSEELVGKTAYFDLNGKFVISNHMTVIRVCSEEVNAYWLAKYLHWLWIQRVFQGLCRRHVNQASVSLERLKQIPIPLPPLTEQREIAHILQAVDRRIAAEEGRVRALEGLFNTLLHELMTGRRRVPMNLVGAQRRCALTQRPDTDGRGAP